VSAIEEAPELRFPDAPKGEFDLILMEDQHELSRGVSPSRRCGSAA
jgi:hypothetical protein